MAVPAPLALKHTFRERAAADNLNDSEILNSNNPDSLDIPNESDVVVAGAGIHGLIYAMHAAKHSSTSNLKITVIEKSPKPAYKIGESTLPYFGAWCKLHGLTPDYILRLFGLKDGFCFYFLDRENQGEYTDFSTSGPPAPFLSTFQIERPMSELLFTLIAQRYGVNVYHGRHVDFKATEIQGGLRGNNVIISPTESNGGPSARIVSSLFVDATGRFRQLASKAAPRHRFEGWNYDAFWGYFDAPKDESKIPFRFYEGTHTNHLCFPEGWVWVIRLPSWRGSATANLMDMVTYLLDCAEAGIRGDQIPSSEELAEMFDLKFQWVTSIGMAVRNDVKYPEDMSAYGTREAERKFNYFVAKYQLLQEFMQSFHLIENHYGPGTTWFIRKTLSYQSPVVSGPGWVAVGDACGFTNPLYSPGITAAMATSTFAAELTHDALKAAENSNPDTAELAIRKTFAPYDDFAKRLIPALNLMNRFQYVCFRHPRLGPEVSCLWQFFAGLEHRLPQVTHDTIVGLLKIWAWGTMIPEYETVAQKAIELLSPIPLDEQVPDATVCELIEYSNRIKKAALELEHFHTDVRWDGLLRYYDRNLNYSKENTTRDQYASQCPKCGAWIAKHPHWLRCHACGQERTAEEAALIYNPPLSDEELKSLLTLSEAA